MYCIARIDFATDACCYFCNRKMSTSVARVLHPNGNGNAGSIFVFIGRPNHIKPVIELDDIKGARGFVVTGIAPYDNAGVSIAGAGDINGDGFDDFLIGATYADPGGRGNAGQTMSSSAGATTNSPTR